MDLNSIKQFNVYFYFYIPPYLHMSNSVKVLHIPIVLVSIILVFISSYLTKDYVNSNGYGSSKNSINNTSTSIQEVWARDKNIIKEQFTEIQKQELDQATAAVVRLSQIEDAFKVSIQKGMDEFWSTSLQELHSIASNPELLDRTKVLRKTVFFENEKIAKGEEGEYIWDATAIIKYLKNYYMENSVMQTLATNENERQLCSNSLETIEKGIQSIEKWELPTEDIILRFYNGGEGSFPIAITVKRDWKSWIVNPGIF